MRNIKTFRNNNNNNTRSNLFQNRENSLKQTNILFRLYQFDGWFFDEEMSHELIILARKMEEMEVEMTRQQSDRFDSSIFIAIHYSIRQLEQDRTRNGQQGR